MPKTQTMSPALPKRCAACGDARVNWQFYAKGIPSAKPRFSVLRCQDCGLGWTDPVIPDTEIGAWYPAAYYGKGNVRFHWTIEFLVRLFRKRRARVIRRRARLGPVLDVGCGRGLMLGYLKGLGYDPYGVELSETAAWHARERMGARVHVGDFLGAPYAPKFFSAIIFWHSLEHFRAPLPALRHAHMLLKPGGLLVVAVPNSASLQAKLTGRNWFHLDVPRHYHHFTLRSLERILTDNGFRIVEINHISFEQDPYAWLQSLYNVMGFEFNFLYSWIKNRSSRAVPILSRPAEALGLLLLLPVLAPLSVLLAGFEACLKRGGSVELYAVRQ